ncbi:MAG TPA: tRNA (N(6)-L-threonylcarbamoyladenosine(37)-C(2))-methylthiotransferase MtaB [Ignavibacteriaceae bacterium]|nr:tRNA (N(6)-L-threonylcarbamoyladenosine(37)-C(2))-methylthiotransferase MtaB [Ignavibacteriaceae bacterium]
METVALHTLGCKLNFSETSTIGSQFLAKGYRIVDFKDAADIYVFNTCSVTENAEKECRQLVRRVLRQNPDAYIIVTGCYAQLRPDEISEIEGVDAVLGTKEKFDIFNLLENFNKKGLACTFVSPNGISDNFGHAHSTDADNRTRAYFKIQDGCDYKCSFCTIPRARGLSRSLDPDSLLSEFKSLLRDGYKEIILTGVNVGDYGKEYKTNLFALLCKMVDLPGDFRIRISSVEPNLLSDEIINLTAANEKMCRHFHIPLQSGSPKILRNMRRRYKIDDYSNLIAKLNSGIAGLGIGVDVIVGFPGESEENFLETYNFLRVLDITYLHVFTYSERPDTLAASMPGRVDVFERKRRNNLLRELSDRKKNLFYNKMSGYELEVLFESENQNGLLHGFSSNYVKVAVPFNTDLINNFARVRLNKTGNLICTGEITAIKNSVDSLAS